jgi:hypothetical protein
MNSDDFDDDDLILDAGVLLCWNRDHEETWPADEYEKARMTCIAEESVEGEWTVGRRKNIPVGTPCFLVTQGTKHPRGIIGNGVIIGEPLSDGHYSDATKTTNWVNVLWVKLLPFDEVVPVDVVAEWAPDLPWATGIPGSGFPVKPDDVDALYAVMNNPTAAE